MSKVAQQNPISMLLLWKQQRRVLIPKNKAISGYDTTLSKTLVPALRAKYKISLDVVCKEGDELTFLKTKHVMVSPGQLAIQSHPKHLEKLFELLKIKRGLMPKKTPGHSLLDEPDNSKEVEAQYAKVYWSCIGILLYIASDYVERQYSIRALSQSMSKPTVNELLCMLATFVYVLLGCTQNCLLLTYKGHHGLLHYTDYTPQDYTLEVFSDSDWAKHRSIRKSVSSGFIYIYIFLFGNLLYSSSRSQKAIALSSAEAEI